MTEESSVSDEEGAEKPKKTSSSSSSEPGAIKFVAAVVGLVVTINTAVTGCVDSNVSRSERFRAAVQLEQNYWLNLRDEVSSLKLDETYSEERKREKLEGLALAAQHEVPDFTEYGSFFESTFGELNYPPEYAYLDAKRLVVQDDIKELGELLGVDKSELDSKLAGKQSEIKLTPATTAVVASDAGTSQRASTTLENYPIVAGTQVVALGKPKGWDIDIFWCEGTNRQPNYNTAKRWAELLEQEAVDSQTISGDPIGRIRIRQLSESAQASSFTVVSRLDAIVHDTAKGEDEAAKGLQSILSDKKYELKIVKSIGTPTPWYLSLFACDAT